MMVLKSCPRCKGDLYLKKDHDGAYLSCMQCGYMKDLNEDTPAIRVRVKLPEEAARKKSVAVAQ